MEGLSYGALTMAIGGGIQFSTGDGGNAISFLTEWHGITKTQAIKTLTSAAEKTNSLSEQIQE
jgi:DNA primase